MHTTLTLKSFCLTAAGEGFVKGPRTTTTSEGGLHGLGVGSL